MKSGRVLFIIVLLAGALGVLHGAAYGGATIPLEADSSVSGHTTRVSFPSPYGYLTVLDMSSLVTRLRITSDSGSQTYYDGKPAPGQTISLPPGDYRFSCWSNFGGSITGAVTVLLSDGKDTVNYVTGNGGSPSYASPVYPPYSSGLGYGTYPPVCGVSGYGVTNTYIPPYNSFICGNPGGWGPYGYQYYCGTPPGFTGSILAPYNSFYCGTSYGFGPHVYPYHNPPGFSGSILPSYGSYYCGFPGGGFWNNTYGSYSNFNCGIRINAIINIR
ncbi:MAG: hypothetical protein RDV48_17890 [Candidatus Eremiobacteraeota bacterium]|nr:hypothetical protein [Candidatus Eremiobacteraeota bacterium]